MFKEGVSCGACYELLCDAQSDLDWCMKGGRTLTIKTKDRSDVPVLTEAKLAHDEQHGKWVMRDEREWLGKE